MGVLSPVKGEPGVFRIPQLGKTIKLIEWREDYKYDTVQVLAGTIAAGTTYNLFRDLQNKDKIDTNFTTARRIARGEEMIINRVGVSVLLNACNGQNHVSDVDSKWAIERLYFNLKINRNDVAEGPVSCFPPGIGVTGMTNRSDTAIVTNGVISTAAVPRLLVPQEINADHDLEGIITHFGGGWVTGGYASPTIATGGMFLRCFLNGYVKAALGK